MLHLITKKVPYTYLRKNLGSLAVVQQYVAHNVLDSLGAIYLLVIVRKQHQWLQIAVSYKTSRSQWVKRIFFLPYAMVFAHHCHKDLDHPHI